MALSTSTSTLAAGASRTFNLSPGSALTLTLLPNVRATVTETPNTVSASGVGGNASRVHNLQLAQIVTYGPYEMGGAVVVANASDSGSTVTWLRSDAIVAESASGAASLVSGAGIIAPQPVQNLRVFAEDTGLSVTWDDPVSGPADRYTVTVSPGGQSTSVTDPEASITGLTNGVAYTVSVTPVNSGGSGTAESDSATPTAGPVAVPGLALWYDADQESYSNGANVTGLTDRSGNGFDSLGVSVSNPLFVSSWTNSKPAVAFTSAGSKFLKTGLRVSDVPGPVTVFWAGQLDSVTGNKRILNWRSIAALGVRQGVMIDINGTTLRAYSSEMSSQQITVANTTPYVISYVCGASTVYLNGTASSSVTKSSVPALNPGVDQYLYFNSDYGTAIYGDQKCGELLVYRGALTQAQRWVVEAYLAAKYNITVVQA